MGSILDREKNRDNAIKQIKSMVKQESLVNIQTEIEKDYPETAPDRSMKKESMIVIPTKEEARSKRVNLLIKPSLHKAAQKKCDKLGISLNECINQLIDGWVNQ